MAILRQVSKFENVETINAILHEDGCVVITDVMTSEDLSRISVELNKHFDEVPVCQGNFFGFATKRMSSIFMKSEVSQKLAVNEQVLEIMDHFLLKSCREYQLNLTQAIQIFPGEPAQIIHTDDLMFPFELPVRGDQKMINCMWAIDDFKEENGATQLVPGSHHWPRDRQAQAHEIVQGIMPAGSVLIYFGSLLHGGGANRSSKSRIGLVLSYSLGWLRQAENHYLASPFEVVKSFPQRLQRLLGYFVHEPNLGCVEGKNPILLLDNKSQINKRFEEFIPIEFHEPLAEYRKSVVG